MQSRRQSSSRSASRSSPRRTSGYRRDQKPTVPARRDKEDTSRFQDLTSCGLVLLASEAMLRQVTREPYLREIWSFLAASLLPSVGPAIVAGSAFKSRHSKRREIS